MSRTKLFDEITLKRRQILENHLDAIFPNVMARLICTYDCYLEGKSFRFDCFPDRLPSTFDNPGDYTIHCICALRDGRIVVGGNNVWKILNPLTGSCCATYTHSLGSAICVAELHDGRIVIGLGASTTQLQIWNLQTEKCDMILQNDEYIGKIVVLLDGRIMGSCFDMKSRHKGIVIKIWDLKNSSPGGSAAAAVDAVFSNHMSKCYTVDTCINMFPNGQIIVVTNHHSLARWNPQTKDIHIISKNKYIHFMEALILSNGQIIISDHYKLKICTTTCYKKHKNENFRIIVDNSAFIYRIVELPDERIAYLNNSKLEIFDLKNNKCDMVLTDNFDFITGIGVLPSGSIVCASQEGIVTVIN